MVLHTGFVLHFTGIPYDPFKGDIFTIGNVIRGELQAVSSHSLVDIFISFLCRITPT